MSKKIKMETVEIFLSFEPHYKLNIFIDNPRLLSSIKEKLVTVDNIVFRAKRKHGLGELRFNKEITTLWTPIDLNTISIDAGLIDYVFKWFPSLIDRKLFAYNVKINIPKTTSIILKPHWVDMLREDQKEDIQALTKHYGGIAAQYPGFGKSLSMLAMIDSMEGRSLILVPNNSILAEIQLRGNQFGVLVKKYDWKGNVTVVNPVAFLRSKEKDNPEAKIWLSAVKNVFTDEAHHLQANSWDVMFSEYLPDVCRSYGFSASPDTKNGKNLSPESVDIAKFGYKNSKIVGLSGTIRVTRKSKASVTLVEVTADISSENLSEFECDVWQDALTHMLKRSILSSVVVKVMKRFPATKFFIPIHAVEPGLNLYKSIIRKGIKGVFWSHKNIYPPCPDENMETLTHVKNLMERSDFQFLITTSLGFEGISINVLSGVIPLIGSQYSTTVQPAGRSSRGDNLVYVVIYDKKNSVMMKQSKKRIKLIESEYPIVHRVKITVKEDF